MSLKQVVPFTGLPLAMLYVIAGAVARRTYLPGAEILAAGSVPDEVHVPVAGGVACGGMQIAYAFDIAAVASDRTLLLAYVAGEVGCTTVAITRPHALRLLRECPELSIAVAGMPNVGIVAR